jgi:hypothetical protein
MPLRSSMWAGMAPFSADAWLVLAGVAGVCLLSCLYALASLYRDQTRLHDLKVRVHDLRHEYAERVARQQAEYLVESAPSLPSPSPGVQSPASGRAAA